MNIITFGNKLNKILKIEVTPIFGGYRDTDLLDNHIFLRLRCPLTNCESYMLVINNDVFRWAERFVWMPFWVCGWDLRERAPMGNPSLHWILVVTTQKNSSSFQPSLNFYVIGHLTLLFSGITKKQYFNIMEHHDIPYLFQWNCGGHHNFVFTPLCVRQIFSTFWLCTNTMDVP